MATNVNDCEAIPAGDIPGCFPCNYVPPTITHVLVRKKADKWQVKVNGKGKWIPADYNTETQKIYFTY